MSKRVNFRKFAASALLLPFLFLFQNCTSNNSFSTLSSSSDMAATSPSPEALTPTTPASPLPATPLPSATPTTPPPAASPSGNIEFKNFVTVKNGRLFDGSDPFRFLASSEALMMRMSSYAEGSIDDTNTWNNYVIQSLDLHAKLGMKAVRIWANPEFEADSIFTYGLAGGLTKEALASKYFERLDFILKKAEERQVRVIMVLFHPWPAVAGESGSQNYGAQLLRHCSPASMQIGKTYEVFTKPSCINDYLTTVTRVFERANAYKNNLKYKNDKTILSWELFTEPMNDTTDPNFKADWVIGNWIQSVSQSIKTFVSPQQPITVSLYADDLPEMKAQYPNTKSIVSNGLFSATGGPRTSIVNVAKISSIDYLDVHIYTKDPAGIWADVEHFQGALFLNDIKKIAKANSKPLIVSEFATIARSYVRGATNQVTSIVEKPDAQLNAELETYFSNAWCSGVDGMVYWHLFPEIDSLAKDTDPSRATWESYTNMLLQADYNVFVPKQSDFANPSKPAGKLKAWSNTFFKFPDNKPYCDL